MPNTDTFNILVMEAKNCTNTKQLSQNEPGKPNHLLGLHIYNLGDDMSAEGKHVNTSQTVCKKRYLKVPDVAVLMDVPTSTVYDLARQKRIGGMVRFGRHIRFDRDALERWLQAGGECEGKA